RHVEELRPGKVALRGHSFKAPRARLESRAEARRAGGAIYDAPPAFDAPDAGDRLARLRLEQESVAAAAAHGASDALGLVPGVVFSLDGHAETRMNRRWLVTSMEHEFAVEDAGARAGAARYANRFTAIAADVPFRPRSTPPPPVGIQTAVVVGPAGQSVHCDELGRVKVQFAWDREGRLDDQSSSWIRVSQAWAGGGHGALFVPRIGDEVLVDFVGGDVDRPVIVGSVYNGENLPPSSLPADRTAAVLRADSTPGREGTSELRIEAQSGRERVKLVAFRDLDVRVGEDRDETVAGDETARVGGDRERAVEGEESIAVRKDRGLAVGGSHGVTVGGDEDRTIGGDHAVAVGGDRTLDVTGKLTDIVGEHLVVRVGGNRTDTVLGASREAVVGERAVVAGRQTVEVKASSELDVGGDADVRVGGALKTRVGELTELVCGAATITVHADGTVELEGRDVVVKVAGAVTVEGERLSVRSQGSVDVSAGGSVRVRGRGVSFN
ncbi:MAG TPA: type VI secretion system tip protein TssI/VgrG, partial [Minicystis sp.]|nr:type VI secretion system tip protein TssI/VgrG [Minicystis sp.]